MAIVETLHVLSFRLPRNFSIKVAFTGSKVVVDNNREQRLHRVQDGIQDGVPRCPHFSNGGWRLPEPADDANQRLNPTGGERG